MSIYTPTTNVLNACFSSLTMRMCYQALDFLFRIFKIHFFFFNLCPLLTVYWVTCLYLLMSSGSLHIRKIMSVIGYGNVFCSLSFVL